MLSPMSEELYIAWIDYCTTNRLIAYGELTGEESEEYARQYVEKRAREMYEKDTEKIRSKYAEETKTCVCSRA